ncbi:hypothetical protein GCM10027446_02810 [Angustibacter peucedani]
MSVRRAGGLLATAALTLLAVLGPAQQAQAHAFLTASNPSDGQTVHQAPTALQLDFSELVVVGSTTVDVVDGGGHHLPVGTVRIARDAADGSSSPADEPVDTEDPVRLVADLPALPQGTYRVHWRTLSADDLHRTEGVLTFGVGVAVSGTGTVDEAPDLLEAAGRWVLWGATAAVLGALVVSLLAGTSLVGPRRRRLEQLARAGSAAALVAAVLLPVAQLGSPRDAWVAAQVTEIGLGWGARVAAAVVLLALAPSVVGRRPERRVAPWHLGLVGLALLAVPTTTALRGHLASTGTPVLVVADVVHATSAALWAGAVVALAVVHVRGAGRRPVVPARGFALVAATAAVLAVASGLVLAGHGVATTTALWRSEYGRFVLVKGALLVAALVLALVNHRRGRRAGGAVGANGRRAVAVEGGVLVALLVAAGVLAATAPANSPQWTPGTRPSKLVSLQADDLQLQVALTPNRPGESFVSVGVLQTRRPVPAAVRAVHVELRDGAEAGPSGDAVRQPDGSWTLPVQLTAQRRWTVAVAAERPGLPVVRAELPWTVGGGVHGPPGTRLARLTTPAALLVAAAGLLLCWRLLRELRGRRPRVPRVPRSRRRPARPVEAPVLPRQPERQRVGSRTSSVAVVVLLAGSWVPGSPVPHARLAQIPSAAAVLGASPMAPAGAAAAVVSRQLGPVPAADPPPPVATGPLPASLTQVGWAGGATPPSGSGVGPTSPRLAGLQRLDVGGLRLPAALLAAYRAAAAAAPAGCHLPVSLLAGIGQVESGSLAGRSLDAAHRAVPPVLGPVLDGSRTAAVRDSDGGRLDGDVRWDRAVGPMQFIPGTWARYGQDADHDGVADPQDVDDAAAAAATYLCAGGRDLATAAGLRAAVLSYNHSDAYLAVVLAWQQRFAVDGVRTTTAPSVPPAPQVTTPATTRPRPVPAPSPTTARTTPAPPPSTPPSPPTTPATTTPTTPPLRPEVPSCAPLGADPLGALPAPTPAPTPTPTPALPTAVPTPSSTSETGATTTPTPVVPSDVAVSCVPPQPTDLPVPPGPAPAPGGPVAPAPTL